MGWRDTFDILKDKTVDLAHAGVAQSKRLAEIAKLKTANMGEEDTIKKAYLEIGKLYYAEKGAVAKGAYASACDKITAAKAIIETNNDRIAELRCDGDSDDDIVAEEAVMPEEPVDPNGPVTEADFEEDVPAEETPAQEEAEAPAEEKPEEKPAEEETKPEA